MCCKRYNERNVTQNNPTKWTCVTFGFVSHTTMLYSFAWVTGWQNSQSRPFQLALGFAIVAYGINLSTTDNLT